MRQERRSNILYVMAADISGEEPRAVVLWFRRFRARPGLVGKLRGELQFEQLLEGSIPDGATPLTMQDESVQVSARFMQSRFPVSVVSSLGIYALFHLNIAADDSTLLLLFFVAVAFIWSGRKHLIHKFGFVEVRKTSAQSNAADILLDLHLRRRMGLAIVRCPGGTWRDVVRTVLPLSEAAIIDVTDLSENVVWELRETARCLPADSIILCCCSDRHEAWADTAALIENAISPVALDGIKVFWYPRRSTAAHGLRLRQELWSLMSEALRPSPYRRCGYCRNLAAPGDERCGKCGMIIADLQAPEKQQLQ